LKYKPYKASLWEERFDRAIRVIAPQRAYTRLVAREKAHYFSYLQSQSTSARRNAGPMTSGETFRGSREKMQIMWNAIQCVENSGLCSAILNKFETYVCGTLRWQARTGVKAINDAYESYIREKCGKPGNIDLTGRSSLRQMSMLDIKGILLKGDIGTNIVREGNELYLQGIEADRIGNPYTYAISNNYVRGLIIDDVGRIIAAKVYRRNRVSGTYYFDDTFPTFDEFGLPKFLFTVNPISYDDYRGVSIFKSAINNITYIDKMREYELQTMLWGSSQSGIFYTASGLLPEKLPFDTNEIETDSSGNQINSFSVRPNTVTALGVGEKVEMFKNERPSPNIVNMYHDTIRDIAVGCGLSYGFVYDLSGLTGPAVRQCSAQDSRAIGNWQQLLRESKLDPVVMLLLGNAIANGDLPYHPNWMDWQWFFPAKPTIDVGRESIANINEIQAGINTGANVAADSGEDIDQIQQQTGHEIEERIKIAMDIAKRNNLDWREVITLMIPPTRSGVSPLIPIITAQATADPNNPDKPGATGNPTPIGGDEEDGDQPAVGQPGYRQPRETIVLRHEFVSANGHSTNGHIDIDKTNLSAFLGDTAISELPEETVSSIKEKVGNVDNSKKVARYGMTASELSTKADPHNMESARKNIKGLTIAKAAEAVHGAPDKHVLMMNDKVVDGHHHLAKAIKGKVTKALPVVDLTPLRFQQFRDTEKKAAG
jgi:capsid protein